MKLNELDLGFGGGSLLQVANRSWVQMMSYIVDTPEGKTIVIDGGHLCQEDGEHLYNLIKERGGKVDLWIITHAHDDHFGALSWLFANKPDLDIVIEKMCFNFPPLEWFKTVENGGSYEKVKLFLEQLETYGVKPEKLIKGDMLECGGVSIEVLMDCENYEEYNNINDTSVPIMVHFPKKEVLFLGDLYITGGINLLAACGPEKIKCDIVQMAHHGQNGVDKDIYEAISPKVCLYTAPDWLWDNDNGGGKGSGPWRTLETRGWMDEIGVEHSCPCAYGDYLLK